ncbi:MAG: hypothetical protein EP329_27930 [Deltaproteobacteria bacterium]|nr:MAG: hypothetical protein EP329_27930 [Deltaproteobacteria bacterium]
MARLPRVDFPGAWHHVMNRGARRADIFLTDAHCTLFLDLVGQMVEKHGIEVHAYSLMPNHFHLLVRSPTGNLSQAMKFLVGVYTQRLNRLCGWDGPVFRGRYRSKLVDEDAYLNYLFAYVHLNPLRAKLVGRVEEENAWTSFRAHLGLEGAPAWLSRDGVRSVFGSPETMADAIRSLHLRKDWPEGSDLESDVPRWPADATGGGGLVRVDTLLEQVAAVTGAGVDELRRAARGRGANPARRFAVVALAELGGLKHREIGTALAMTSPEVANVLYRVRKAEAEPFAAWRRALGDALAAS